MIDAVLFDLGDTIINFGIGRAEAEVLFEAGARATYSYLAARDKPLPPYQRYFRSHYWRMRNEYLWSKLIRRDFNYGDVIAAANRRLRIPVQPAELEELAWLWYEPIVRASYVDAGVPEMLTRLRSAGTKMAIVSNTFVPGHCLDRHLEREGLLEFFPVRIYSSNVRYRKPHRRIFQLALEQVGVSAECAVFIGDLPKADIAGAQRAGMKAVWKPAAHNPPAPRRHHPDWMIRSITQLPEALPHLGWRNATARVGV